MHALLAALDPAVDPVVVAAPGTGPGCWAGAPYAAPAGSRIALAYRLRRPESPVPGTGSWDARGSRVGWVHADPEGTWWALYDGRASAAENFHERTGLARGRHPGRLRAVAGPVPAAYGSALRYVSVVAVPDGHRVFYEAGAADGSHALHTAYLPG